MDKDYPGRGLDQKLLTALTHLVRNSVISDRPSPLELNVFLCVLWSKYPDEIKAFFQNPDRFSELAPRLYPEPIKDVTPEELAYRMRQKLAHLKAPPPGKGQVSGLDIALDSSLARIFQEAASLAMAAGRQKAEISDFIGAVSLDHELLAKLYEETGLRVRGPWGPEPKRE